MIKRQTITLTQGSIFSHAVASKIETNVFGLVITARCDLSHSKISLINYIPLITLKDWIKIYANEISVERLTKSAEGNAKQCLINLGESSELLNYFSTDAISIKFDNYNQCKKKKKHLANLIKNMKYRDELKAYKSVDNFDEDFFNNNRKIFNNLIIELTSNKLADYHFFSSIKPDASGIAYVALLREIRFIPICIASHMCKGIDFELYNQLVSDHNCSPHSLSMINDECFCEVLGYVKSPEIELIMQRTTGLFSRIGVDDTSKEVIDRLLNAKIGDEF